MCVTAVVPTTGAMKYGLLNDLTGLACRIFYTGLSEITARLATPGRLELPALSLGN
jgi:hypothetical protein